VSRGQVQDDQAVQPSKWEGQSGTGISYGGLLAVLFPSPDLLHRVRGRPLFTDRARGHTIGRYPAVLAPGLGHWFPRPPFTLIG
jgi:hypothetical protein